MNLNCAWDSGLKFTARSGEHAVGMDTKPPLGTDTALTPKQLLVAGVCGCTGMDVVALLKKFRQPLDSFQIEAEAISAERGYPEVFKEIRLTFKLAGAIDPPKALEAVRLSQTKYCGVSAMVCKAVPITYQVQLNGEAIGTGEAHFQ